MTLMKTRTITIVVAGMFAALTGILSQISIPMPIGVPITLQTLAVALCGYVLGWKLGLISIGVWAALGTVGLPVFSNFQGGIGMLIGMTGGFIFGFFPFVVLCGIGRRMSNIFLGILLGLLGLIICHMLGVIQFSLVTETPLMRSAALVSLPYLIKDIASVAAAFFLAMAIRKSLKAAKLMQ